MPLYNAAANLATVLRVLNTVEDADWMSIETTNSKGYTKQDFFWLSKLCRRALQLKNRFLAVTLDIWDKWKQKLVWQHSPQMTLGSVTWPMSDLDVLMKTWKAKTICKLKDILHKNTLLPKQDLQDKMNIHLGWMHYFQIRAMLTRPEVLMDLKKGNMAYEHLIVSEDSSSKHKLSMIYQILLLAESKVDVSNIEAWERNCQTILPQTLWDKLHVTSITTTSIIPIKIQGIKFLYLRYITPTRLHKAKLMNNNLCWKKHHQPADYIHYWWHCPKLTRFWSQIHDIITEMTTCNLQYSPTTLLLHLWSEDKVPRDEEHIVTVLLSLAKTEIAAKWKSDKEPSVSS